MAIVLLHNLQYKVEALVTQVCLLGMHVMHHIFCLKILCDDKVESPVVHLLHSLVQMCTVRPWSAFSPSDSKPREMGQLDATIGTVCGKHSSIHLPECIGEVLLRALGGDKAEI